MATLSTAPAPEPVSVQVCSSCGLPWGDHVRRYKKRVAVQQAFLEATGRRGTFKAGVAALPVYERSVNLQDCVALLRGL